MSVPWRCSPCPGDLQDCPQGLGHGGLCWRAVLFWALQEVVPALCKLRLGSACAVTSAGHLWLISCCLELRAWIPFRNWDLHGCNLGSLVLFSSVASAPCWAQPELLPASQEPTLLHPAPVCGLQHGQAGARGCRKGWGDPMTLSHDLPPTPAPAGCADGAFPP